MSLVEIPLDDLAMVAPFRASMDARYYLNGVLVSPCDKGGAMVVATNGHVLVAYHSLRTVADKDRILHFDENFGSAVREFTSNTSLERWLRIESESAHSIIADASEEKFVKPGKPFIDGKYPDWRKVIPPTDCLKPGLSAPLQTEYIVAFKKCLSKERAKAPLFFWHDEREPIANAVVARFDGIPDLIIVCMPVRADRVNGWPGWMEKKAAKEKAA